MKLQQRPRSGDSLAFCWFLRQDATISNSGEPGIPNSPVSASQMLGLQHLPPYLAKTNGLNHRDWFSHGSAGPDFKIKVWVGSFALRVPGSLLQDTLLGLQVSLFTFGLTTSSFLDLSPSLCPHSSFLKDTSDRGGMSPKDLILA